MIVVPEGAEGFIDVAAFGLVIGKDSGILVGIVLVVELAAIEEVARIAVTF